MRTRGPIGMPTIRQLKTMHGFLFPYLQYRNLRRGSTRRASSFSRTYEERVGESEGKALPGHRSLGSRGHSQSEVRIRWSQIGPAGLVDLRRLHMQWYAWTMQEGPKPYFLRKPVAYYVMGAERWRYANTLDEVTSRSMPLYLQSRTNPTDVFQSGSLCAIPPAASEADHYVYDPKDVSHASLESTIDPDSATDDRLIYAPVRWQLVYHTAPFDQRL